MNQMQALKALIRMRQMTQKYRIAMDNRSSHSDEMDSISAATVEKWARVFGDNEDEISAEIIEIAIGIPIVNRLLSIKGVGAMLAARIVAEIDIQECTTVSKMWRYAGIGLYDYWADADGVVVSPRNGYRWNSERQKVFSEVNPLPDWHLVKVRDRKMYGWVIPFNPELKSVMYNVGQSFIKSNSPYRKIYDESKEEYLSRGWTRGHASIAAMRKMNKIFLQHLWAVWREMESLPVTKTYAELHGHIHIYNPQDFGWTDNRTKKKIAGRVR